MDQDLGAIDEAELVMTKKEHKLERLLTQKNMLDTALVRLTRSQNACIVYETEGGHSACAVYGAQSTL